MKLRNLTFYILHFAFYISMAQTAAWDSLRGGVHVVTNEQDAAAMARIVSATNGIPAQIAAATNGVAAQMSELRSDMEGEISAATNGLPERMEAMIPNLAPYALKSELPDMPDMSPYALKSELPEIPDLAPYATKHELGLATNGLPARIAAVTNGLPERIASSTNALHTSLAPTISAASTALQPAATNNIPETLATHAGELARLSQALAANTESNTAYRLMSPEGDIYQDATGAVWRVAYATNLSPWHVSVVAYTNGTSIATNEIPGITAWSIDGIDTGVEEVGWKWMLYYGSVKVAENEAGRAESDTIVDFTLEGEISQVDFARTNIVTRYWTPADKVLYASSGASGGITTNDVQAIVTNETEAGFSEWVVEPPLPSEWAIKWYPGDGASIEGGWVLCPVEEPPSVDSSTSEGTLTSTQVEWSADDSALMRHYVATRTKTPSRNALGLARLADLPQLTNGLATAASVTAANSRAASAQNVANAASNTAANVAGTVAAWETYWDGDEVRVTVTNYYGSQDIPSLYIEEKNENTNTYRVVWDERTRWRTNAVEMAELRSAINEKADRAWGYYESHTGDYAPDGYTWLSSPKIAIAGGLAYQRTLTTAGAVWVLASNGMVAQTGGTEDGFFRIKDDEGNVTFEIVRGNKRTVGATAAGIKVESSGSSHTITIPYNVVSEASPTLYGTANLASGEWTELSTATWLGQSGAWTGIVTTASSSYFVKAEYETGGETYIKNVAPISAESGIYCTDGIHKVRPVYGNGTVTWEVVQ